MVLNQEKKMVIEANQEDNGDGNVQCTNHPYKNNTPGGGGGGGGICAFCLQEKLGKLVSSNYPVTVHPSSSSSPSPSFRSDHFAPASAPSNLPNKHHQDRNFKQFHKSKIPFMLTHKKKSPISSDKIGDFGFKRSKSSVSQRNGVHYMGGDELGRDKRRFWSFLHLHKHPNAKNMKEICYPASSVTSFNVSEQGKTGDFVVEENESPVAFDRKVCRSRSVGCGSRSFSGDLFERISTGFGDCTLRRVESQREGKSGGHRGAAAAERVKCGGLFGGFMVASSSSSSSSSYWVSSIAEDDLPPSSAVAAVAGRQLVNGRHKSWGWALASPIRAFKPNGKKDGGNKNGAPNLAAIPSLLAV